mmetsp:Transcript_14167/g.38940  ORF Transcript_14167/g.38940 Transcript_14167/m.38940 type:complete len:89 (+) Transcript_14167:259-525(+)
MIPLLMTQILSARSTVERRCATMTTVMSCWAMRLLMALCTSISLSASNALVASSRSNTFGRRTKARAIEIRCFCPPDNCTPRSPTSLS